jgi:N-acetyl-anhydromuramyl-L-alanine amidase AmpD
MLFGTGPDEYTSEQMSILANKCREIAARHPTINDVCGHSDVDPINKPHCPGFDVREWAKKTGIMPRCPR